MEDFFHGVSLNVTLTNFTTDYETVTYSLNLLCDIPELLSLFFAGGFRTCEGQNSDGLQRRHDAAHRLPVRHDSRNRLQGAGRTVRTGRHPPAATGPALDDWRRRVRLHPAADAQRQLHQVRMGRRAGRILLGLPPRDALRRADSGRRETDHPPPIRRHQQRLDIGK